MQTVLAYAVTLVVFAVIDSIWLGTMGSRLYRPILGDILLPSFRVAPAIVFYLFYSAGLVVFAVAPALESGGWLRALTAGALFGLFAYGTYDLTNYATLRNWDLTLTAVDMAWGAFVSGVAAALATLLAAWLGRLAGLAV